jgi:hypothetical protein
MGTLVAPLEIVNDEHGKRCYLFAFPDVRVRFVGTYRLHFQLYDMREYAID